MIRTIIIPVYNGEQYLDESLKDLSVFLNNSHGAYEVIFVDDGSTDNTYKILEEYKKNTDAKVAVITYSKNRGKGYAIREGMKRVSIESGAVGFTDVDIPYGMTALQQGFEVIENDNVAFVYGSRTEAGKKQRQYSLYRKIGAYVFRLCLPRKVRNITDTQSGLKIFRKKEADTIFSLVRTGQWVFDIELFLIASAHDMPIRELPVTLKSSSITRRGGVRVMKHGFRILYDIAKIRIYALRGLYTKT